MITTQLPNSSGVRCHDMTTWSTLLGGSDLPKLSREDRSRKLDVVLHGALFDLGRHDDEVIRFS